MPYQVVSLPTVTVSSGGTAFAPVWDKVDDASFIAIRVSASTAPGIQVQGEITATGTDFRALVEIMVATSAGGPALASNVTASSGYILQINPAGMRQIRLATTAASTGGLTAEATKWIHVV
jgi:hypothetical protein